MLKRRPLQVWKAPKSYRRSDGMVGWLWGGSRGWLWRCLICRVECSPPHSSLATAYRAAVEHLNDEHLSTEWETST